MKILLPILLLSALLFTSCSRRDPEAERKVKFYQSPMHPWITSDKPGNCTICGMKLTPVYEGQEAKAVDPGRITLQPGSAQVMHVATALATKAPLERELRLAGEIEDSETKHRIVSAFFEGRIDQSYVDHVGQEVTQGQPLAAIYSPELLYVVREYQEAFRSGNRNAAENAGKRLIQYGLTPDQVGLLAQKNPDKYGIDLRSPIDGTVITRSVYTGQYVKKGDVLFELGDFSTMWFHAKVYESDLAWIHVGEKASISTPAVAGKSFEGAVTFIDPNFDPVTRSTNVRIEVPNPLVETAWGQRRELPHRAFGEAIIKVNLGEAIVVPRTAVLDTGRRQIVFVEEDGSYVRRDVTIGRKGEKDVEILKGITPGEKVVISGNLMLDAESQLAIGSDTVPSAAIADTEVFNPLVGSAARLSDALATDNLEKFNAEIPVFSTALANIPSSVNAVGLAEIREKGKLTTVPDLKAARKEFLPLSDAVSSLVIHLKKQGAFPEVKVFKCPMSEQTYDGAPTDAKWVQEASALKNPWFGAGMVECGEEVRP